MTAHFHQPTPPGRKRLAVSWLEEGAKTPIQIQAGDAAPREGARILSFRSLRAHPVIWFVGQGQSFHFIHHSLRTTFSTFNSHRL